MFWNQVVFIDKIRSAAFDLLDDLIQGKFWIEQEEAMDMVLHSVDYPDGTSHLDKLLVHVVVNRFLFVQVDIEITIFCGPYRVDPDSNIGVGHGGVFWAKLFLAFWIT